MRHKTGTKIVRWRGRWSHRRVGQRTPRGREVFLYILMRTQWHLVQWLPREGWWTVAAGLGSEPDGEPYYFAPRYQGDAMKRRLPAVPGTAVVPPLPSASTLLPKLPALREFITATKYEDNTPREPGYFTVRNRVTTFEVTVYDPDSASRISARGKTLDEALGLVEQLIGVEEAPWEPDAYLAQLAAKKRPRKKGA